jgi:hypothetical protein
MPTDTSEKGLDALIVAAMTGPVRAASAHGAGVRDAPAPYSIPGWVPGDSKSTTAPTLPTRPTATRSPTRTAKMRVEMDSALWKVMVALMKDDTELFKQFSDNESFRRGLMDAVFALTYASP